MTTIDIDMDTDEVQTSKKKNNASTSSSSATATTAITADDLPWIEKHRPRTLSDVVGNSAAIDRLKQLAQHGNLPNLILTGPPGVGKTTSILCLAYQMLPTERLREDAILELNASDSRGIDVIRQKIKFFAQKKVNLPNNTFKFIILDEADSLTTGAQQALRRIMEMYTANTRFFLACNSSEKIIEAIQSRCAILRFSKITEEQMYERLVSVLQLETIVNYTDSGLEAIVFTSLGDMRMALNTMQSTYVGFHSITAENVYKIVDTPHPLVCRQMITYCVQNEFKKSVEVMSKLWTAGYGAIDILTTIFALLKNHTNSQDTSSSSKTTPATPLWTDEFKMNCIRECAQIHLRCADGTQTFLQMTSLLARMCRVGESQMKQSSSR